MRRGRMQVVQLTVVLLSPLSPEGIAVSSERVLGTLTRVVVVVVVVVGAAVSFRVSQSSIANGVSKIATMR